MEIQFNQTDYTHLEREYPGRIKCVGPRNKPALIDPDDVLKFLAQGYTIRSSKTSPASWLVKPDGNDANILIGWGAFNQLERQGKISKVKEFPTQLEFSISKSGGLYLKSETRRKDKLDIKKETSKEVKTEETTEDSPHPLTVISTGNLHIATVVLKKDEDLKRFKQLLKGLSVTKAEKKVMPKIEQVCYYCKETFEKPKTGPRPFREVCKTKKCKEQYKGDLAAKKELEEAGLLD